MRTSITEGPDTFTRLRVQNILLEERHICKPDDRGYPTEFQIYSFRYGPSSNLEFFLDDFRAADKERAEAQRWCEEVITELHQGSTGHIQALDNWYSNLLTCHFQTDDPEDIVDRTCFLLRRLPPTVPEFCDSQTKGSYKRLGQDYFPDDSDRVWENLRAANFISRNVIRIALRVELAKDHESSWDNPLRNIINTTTLLLKAAIDLSGKRPSKKWFIVKAFLWTSWKRAISLAYHHTMERQLLHGQYSSNTLETLLDGVDILEEVSKWTQPSNEQERPPDYMCMWALNLLKSNHAVIGQDYRRFFERFHEAFSHQMPRCVNTDLGNRATCNPRHPEKCLRLSGMVIQNQSAHATNCKGNCRRLFWDEASWVACRGAAAVCLGLGADDGLNYRDASESTMAVSHVWSHGQGGRPENNPTSEGTGLNSCLHDRYVTIAKAYGCDSYWMDTPCIPTDHRLRRIAIANINQVFADSKLTLVCDKDLMTIDVETLDVGVQESILATVLVCDWNVRAWTLLEALRGRRNLHILCKNERVVSLRGTVEDVNRNGNIDIANLFLSAKHLLPTQPYIVGIPKDDPRQLQQWTVSRRKGFVNVTEAAGLLSHRHASRPGDEIVIWGLLTGDEVFFTAEDLWRKQEDRFLPTCWLVCSHDRVANRIGLSWAPLRPNFPLLPQGLAVDRGRFLFPHGSADCEFGLITRNGLQGRWRAYEFKVPQQHFLRKLSMGRSKLKAAVIPFLDNRKWCAILQPFYPLRDSRTVPHPQRLSKKIFAIVTSSDRVTWQWRGLVELDRNVTIPELSIGEYLIA